MLNDGPDRQGTVKAMATDAYGETLVLLETYHATGDMDIKEQLVTKYLPLVRSLCRRFRASRESQDDLVQVGVIGLLNAIDKFDTTRGNRFSSLAIPEVLGIILNYLRDHGEAIRMPRVLRKNKLAIDRLSESLACMLGHWPTPTEVASACHLTEEEIEKATEAGRTVDIRSLDQALRPDDSESGFSLSDCLGHDDQEFELSLNRIVLHQAMDTLPVREKRILKLRFFDGLSQRQTAQRIDISQMHVSRLERDAIQKLRSELVYDELTPDSEGLLVAAAHSKLAAAS